MRQLFPLVLVYFIIVVQGRFTCMVCYFTDGIARLAGTLQFILTPMFSSCCCSSTPYLSWDRRPWIPWYCPWCILVYQTSGDLGRFIYDVLHSLRSLRQPKLEEPYWIVFFSASCAAHNLRCSSSPGRQTAASCFGWTFAELYDFRAIFLLSYHKVLHVRVVVFLVTS